MTDLPETLNIQGVDYTKTIQNRQTYNGFTVYSTRYTPYDAFTPRERMVLIKPHLNAIQKLQELNTFDKDWKMVQTEADDVWYFYKKGCPSYTFTIHKH